MRSLLRAGLALGLLAAACKDSIGPKSLANPQATTGQMAALDTLFNAAALNSFSALAGNIAPSAPRLAALRALASASNPLAGSSALRPYSKGLESAQLLRQLVPTLTSASTAGLFPPTVVGKTFEWNLTTAAYEPTARTGAPVNGVRFILYAVDPLSHLPVDPLVEVGYVDLNDEGTANLAKVHVTVAGVGGTPVYVDYTVSLGAISGTSARLATAGYITNAAGSPDTLRFSGAISVAGTVASASVTQDVRLDVNSRDLHIRLWEQVTFTQTTAALRIYYRLQHGAEVVTLNGRFNLDSIGQTVDGTISVAVDGGRFATCTVAAGTGTFTLTCQGADADGLNADEEEALQAIGDGIEHATQVFQGLFLPALSILGA